MRITEIRYEHRVPRAQFESETLSAFAVVEWSDDVYGAISSLKSTVNGCLNLEIPRPELPLEIPKQEEPKKEEPKKEEPKKRKTAKRKTKPKFVVYDRDDENHKKELGIFLDEFYPNWENSMEKAVNISQKMDKVTPLYDSVGDITAEFKQIVHEGMK